MKTVKKRYSITRKLFRTYTTLFLVFYAVSVVVAVAFMAHSIHGSIVETQKQMAQTISKAAEGYLEDMNDFSLSLMNSTAFKQAVLEDLPEASRTGESMSESLLQVYSAAYEMFEKGYYVGVATRDGTYIWLADRILVQPYDRSNVSAYDDYTGYGKPVLLTLDDNPFLEGSEETDGSSDGHTIVLARSINISNKFAVPQAMLEVQVPRNDFKVFMDGLTDSAGIDGLHVTIFSAAGDVLCGRTDSASLPSIDAEGGWVRDGGNMALLRSVFSGGAYILFEIPVGIYYQKLILFLLMAVLFSGVLCALLMAVTYPISRKLTRPMQQLSAQLEGIDLRERLTFDKVDTDIYELDILAQTVTDMNRKLIDSMDSIVALRTAELQSRLMALQSQMQPHFLYNTLASISTLNDQGNREAVTRLCAGLSQMLRYVSSRQDEVSLYDEVKFLRSYMAIMQERFPSAKLNLDIPLEMMQLRVPKLILQPLAENAFKHASRADTEITVTGTGDGDRWIIRVEDNGEGFTKEQAAAIEERIRQAEKDSAMLSAQIDGMGLVNIHARLSLYYRGEMVFRIFPGSPGTIEIGGSVHAGEG